MTGDSSSWFEHVFEGQPDEGTDAPHDTLKLPAHPKDIVDELLANNWSRPARELTHFVRLTPPDNLAGTPSIVVPLDAGAPDYEPLMAEAALQLARMPELWRRIVIRSERGNVDTIHFRKETDAPSGTISWAQGEEFFAAARRVLLAGAKSYVAPQRRFSQKFGQFAGRYMDEVLMGPTAPGSYIITALAPVSTPVPVNARAIRRETYQAVDLPPARVVTTRVVESVQNTAAALADFKRRSSDEQGESFLKRIEGGVSFDILTAVLDMVDAGSQSSVSVDWSEMDHSVLIPKYLDRQFIFEPSDYAVLEKAAVLLAGESQPTRIQRTGYVQMMRKPEVGAPTVIAVSALEPDGKRRRYRVRLTPEQLSTAVQAYESDRAVSVSGVAERDGNLWWMYDAAVEIITVADTPSYPQPDMFEE